MSRTRFVSRCASLLVLFLLTFGETVIALDPAREIVRYGHSVWRTENGLPQNTVRAILQTRDGYIWAATEEGLARFDGIRFAVFDKQSVPEIKSNNIQALYEDRQGSLWVGTDEGLVRLSNGSFKAFSAADGLSNDNVASLYEDREGSLWIGTSGGLSRFKDGQFYSYTTGDGLPGESVSLIHQDREGRLWVSTPGGLARFDGNSFTAYTMSDGLPSSNVVSLFESKNGELWFGTSNGLALFRGDGFAVYTIRDGLSNNMVWSIQEDDAGALYFGTDGGLNVFRDGRFTAHSTKDGLPSDTVLTINKDRSGSMWLGTPGGLARLKDGKISSYTVKDGLSSNVVRAIYEDRESNLWVGTEAGGLNIFKDTKFTTYTAREGLPNDMAWAVTEGRDGSLWVGTQEGLGRLKDGRFTAYTTREGLPSNIVRALTEDSAGNIWAGTPAGLAQLKDGRVNSYTVQDGLSSNAVWAIHEGREGSLWIGTLGGLTRLRDGKFTVYTTRDGLSDDAVLAIKSDSKGGLWVGTREGGLNYFREGRFEAYTTKEGLSDNSIRAIYEDRDGSLWVGTRRGGLSRLKEGRFTAVTTREGLFDDCVYQILDDGGGNLWMSSAKGIFRASRAELTDFADGNVSFVTCISYGTADGMQSRECNGGQPAGWRGGDGRLWFATIKGVATIDPQRISVNEVPPPVAIEKVLADNQSLDPANKAELEAGTDRLEFHYTGLSFVAPEKVRFKYMLEGYDKDWIDAGAERAAYYTSIPPGDYRFRVRACNNDGVWNEAGVSFPFYLKPHFYQTVWFYVALAALAALMGWTLYLLRIRQIKARFAAVLSERNRMAREIHDTLAQGFVGIGLQLDAVNKTLDTAPEKAKHHLVMAESMVKHSITEARRTIWDLRSQALEGGDLAKALSDMAGQLTAGTNVQSSVGVTGHARPLEAAVENNLLRIGQEALTNAMKHASPSRIDLELCFEPAEVRLRVKDDGRGFDATNGSFLREGHFGLVGMRERAERIKGRLDVLSSPGQGTTVTVIAPLD